MTTVVLSVLTTRQILFAVIGGLCCSLLWNVVNRVENNNDNNKIKTISV